MSAAQDRLAALVSSELLELLERVVEEKVTDALASVAPTANPTPWMGVAEAAAYLRVSERKLQRELKQKRVRSSTIGRRRLLHRDDLDALARATTGAETAPTVSPRRREE